MPMTDPEADARLNALLVSRRREMEERLDLNALQVRAATLRLEHEQARVRGLEIRLSEAKADAKRRKKRGKRK